MWKTSPLRWSFTRLLVGQFNTAMDVEFIDVEAYANGQEDNFLDVPAMWRCTEYN